MFRKSGCLVGVLMMLLSQAVCADTSTSQTAVDMEQQLQRLNKVNFHPNLLPVILRNSDFIGLNDEQVSSLKNWGRSNFKPMVATMNAIIRKRIEFEEAAMSPRVSEEKLKRMQEDIFQLHRDLLAYKLSCRKKLLQTLDASNWEEFVLVLGEEGYPVPDIDNTSRIANYPTLKAEQGQTY